MGGKKEWMYRQLKQRDETTLNKLVNRMCRWGRVYLKNILAIMLTQLARMNPTLPKSFVRK